MSVTNLFKRAASRRQTKRLCRINRTPRCVARARKNSRPVVADGNGLPLMKTITASESKGLALISVRLITDCAPPGECLMRRRTTPAPHGAHGEHANYLQFQLLHCFNYLFRMGCRRFAAYAAVWREHAPFSSALSIKPVCLIRAFYSVV